MAIRLSDQQVVQATLARRVRIGGRASYSAVCTDSRQVKPGCLFIALKGERFDAHEFVNQAAEAGAAGAVVQEGRPLKLSVPDVAVYEVPDTLKALGALARFHRERFRIPVGAVTGSNGKTTVKELIAAILEVRGPALKTKGNLNNEVGVPLTLFDLEPQHVAAIIELGMNHAGEIARLTELVQPDAGLVTVVQPAHLEGLGSLDGVAEAKGELFRALTPVATAVVNMDDPRVAAQARDLRAHQLTYGRADAVDVQLAGVEPRGRRGLGLTLRTQGRELPIALRLVGAHNAMNATGAFAMGLALGYSPTECVRGLEAARATAGRLQLVDAPGGVTVVDDCYNANPASMTAALETLETLANPGRPVAVLGDMLELGHQEAQAHALMGLTAAEHAKLVGFFGPRMKAAHLEAKKKLGAAAAHFEQVEPLIAWLKGELQSDDVVLVKGSRGMRLERVVEALTGHAGGGGH